MTLREELARAHGGGVLRTVSRVRVASQRELGLVYLPGATEVARAVADDLLAAHALTWRDRTVAVVTDGSGVCNLGAVGPVAALPVASAFAALLGEFARVNAVPLPLDVAGVPEFVAAARALRPGFGGLLVAGVSAAVWDDLEPGLDIACGLPVFHVDREGTAVAVLAALTNAAAVTGRDPAAMRVVIAGAGPAGMETARLLTAAGILDVAVADRGGVIDRSRTGLPPAKARLARSTNPADRRGPLADALVGADVFVGLSGARLSAELLRPMAPDAIGLLLSDPEPDVDPDLARRHLAVVATASAAEPNALDAILALPGCILGTLVVGATRVTDGMRIAAADALAELVADEAAPDFLLPSALDETVVPTVANAVGVAARRAGVAGR